MQRRIDQPDGHRKPIHRFKYPDEIAPLKRLQLVQGFLAIFRVPRQDHFLDGQLPFRAALRKFEILKEHVLGAAQPNPLRAHFPRQARVLRRVRIRAHP